MADPHGCAGPRSERTISVCPQCGCYAVYEYRARPIFKCQGCDRQFYADEASTWDALHGRYLTKRINHSVAFADEDDEKRGVLVV